MTKAIVKLGVISALVLAFCGWGALGAMWQGDIPRRIDNFGCHQFGEYRRKYSVNRPSNLKLTPNYAIIAYK